MAFNTKSIIKDVNNKPVPQYFNVELDKYEVISSHGGMLRMIAYDSEGNEIMFNVLINEIVQALDRLVEVVTDGI